MESQTALITALRDYINGIPEELNYVFPSDLQSLLNEGEDLFILDNRTPEFYERGHIPGAVNIPLREVLYSLDKIPRDKRVVVCCWVGHTASQLLPALTMLGYKAVGLKYGMGEAKDEGDMRMGWKSLGLPTVSGSAPGEWRE